MKLTLTKTEEFVLRPLGNIKFSFTNSKSDNKIYIGEIEIDHEKAMPFTVQQETLFIKEMRTHKTEVFVDERMGKPVFYTLTDSGLTPISHEKITAYYNEAKKYDNFITKYN